MLVDDSKVEMLVARGWPLSCNDGLRRVIADYDPSDEQVSGEFGMVIDPREVRWYLRAVAIPGFPGRDVPSNALVWILAQRVGVLLLLTWL